MTTILEYVCKKAHKPGYTEDDVNHFILCEFLFLDRCLYMWVFSSPGDYSFDAGNCVFFI